jgi:hypothetical protein
VTSLKGACRNEWPKRWVTTGLATTGANHKGCRQLVSAKQKPPLTLEFLHANFNVIRATQEHCHEREAVGVQGLVCEVVRLSILEGPAPDDKIFADAVAHFPRCERPTKVVRRLVKRGV